jgi:hypothetical protein
MAITSRLSTRSAKADRLARRADASQQKIKSPPKHEKNVLLQSLVKDIQEEKLRKGSDYGVIAATMKARSAQYPWLKRGMLYHLMSTQDSLVKQIILDMDHYLPGRQASAFKKAYDKNTKAKPHMAWLDETFVHFLFKQEWTRRTVQSTTPPPPPTMSSPPPIARVLPTPLPVPTMPPQIARVLPTPVREDFQPSERTFPSTEGSAIGTGSSSAASSSNTEPHSSSSSLGRVAAQVQQTLNMGGAKERYNRCSNHQQKTTLDQCPQLCCRMPRGKVLSPNKSKVHPSTQHLDKYHKRSNIKIWIRRG